MKRGQVTFLIRGPAEAGLPFGAVDTCHVTRYNSAMIKSFADDETRRLFETGASKRFPADILRRALRKLDHLDAAYVLDDLKVPPGNRLHALQGAGEGQHAIAVNDQWRICFRFADGDAFDVELGDYHR